MVFLHYIAVPLLEDYLFDIEPDKPYYTHLLILTAAVRVLNSRAVTLQDVKHCKTLLQAFYDLYPQLYGKSL